VSEQEEMLVRGESGNGMVPVPSDKKERQKLTSKQLGEIGDLCLRIEKHYAFPCDIEWGMEGGTFFILQSRPITTLGEGVLEKEGSFDGHEWFMTVTRNMSFWHQCLSNEGNFHHQKDFNIGAPIEI
jgi:phosphoenolpyruvate synthase/pyruvate phosphate dikinase